MVLPDFSKIPSNRDATDTPCQVWLQPDKLLITVTKCDLASKAVNSHGSVDVPRKDAEAHRAVRYTSPQVFAKTYLNFAFNFHTKTYEGKKKVSNQREIL